MSPSAPQSHIGGDGAGDGMGMRLVVVEGDNLSAERAANSVLNT
jgi:hypothetical protein